MTMQHPPKKQKKTRPAIRRAVVVMLLAVVLAAAFVIGIPHFKARHPGKSAPIEVIPPDFRTLEIREGKELDTIVMHPASGESYTLKMQDGALHLLDGGELLPVSDLYADELLEVLTHIVAQETVTTDAAEVADHLADMGLEPPKAKAVIRYQDGTEAVLEVGAAVPNTTYAYYRWSGDPGIYMCDVGIAEAFALTASHLLPVEQPVVYAALIEEIHLINPKGESRFVFENSTGSLREPFVYPLSDAAAEQLLGAAANFRLGTRQALITDENRAEYGFDAPLCTIEIHQRSGMTNQIGPDGSLTTAEVPAQSLRFVIGRAEGDFFYTCEYEGSCYFISRFLADVLVGAERKALLSRHPAHLGDELIASVSIHAPQGNIAVDVLRSERVLPNNQLELDANGNPVYDALIAINGKEGAQEQLDALTERLQALAAAGEVPETFALSSNAEPRWSIVIETAAGKTRCIEAFRMDAFSDAIRVDGVMQHYVLSDAIDVITAGLL